MKNGNMIDKLLATKANDCGFFYGTAIRRRDYFWIGVFRNAARRSARSHPKDFAAGCRLAVSLLK